MASQELDLRTSLADSLAERFRVFWRCLFPFDHPHTEARERAWRDILVNYGDQRYRRYHSLGHLGHLFRLLDEFWKADPTQRSERARVVVEAILWWHDLIYVPGFSDNERLSAKYVEALLSKDVIPQSSLCVGDTRAIVAGIAATKDHHVPEADGVIMAYAPLMEIAFDLDLAGLGAPWGQFCLDSENIRFEYGFVPDNQFAKGRAVVLKGYRERKPLFRTPYLRDRFEIPAKTNLTRALADLRA